MKEVQYNPKSNFNLFSIGKPLRRAGGSLMIKKAWYLYKTVQSLSLQQRIRF